LSSKLFRAFWPLEWSNKSLFYLMSPQGQKTRLDLLPFVSSPSLA